MIVFKNYGLFNIERSSLSGTLEFFWVKFESIWVNLSQYKSIWVNLCQFVSIWVNLCQFESIWVNLGINWLKFDSTDSSFWKGIMGMKNFFKTILNHRSFGWHAKCSGYNHVILKKKIWRTGRRPQNHVFRHCYFHERKKMNNEIWVNKKSI